jgi:hypothetical protein
MKLVHHFVAGKLLADVLAQLLQFVARDLGFGGNSLVIEECYRLSPSDFGPRRNQSSILNHQSAILYPPAPTFSSSAPVFSHISSCSELPWASMVTMAGKSRAS